jgi:hypothetical protein
MLPPNRLVASALTWLLWPGNASGSVPLGVCGRDLNIGNALIERGDDHPNATNKPEPRR